MIVTDSKHIQSAHFVMEKIRLGILSTAQIARNGHIPGIKGSDKIEVVAIASRNLDKAQQTAEEHDIPILHTSYQDLLNDPEIDAVLNPLPNSLHTSWTLDALKAGKHVLLEKPFTVTVEEAQSLADTSTKCDLVLMEAFTHRFMPGMHYVRDAIQNGEIGEPLQARFQLTYPIEDWANDSRANSELAGGALMDCGCYGVSGLRFLLDDEPVRVNAAERMHPTNKIDSFFAGELAFSKGATGSIFASQDSAFNAGVEIIGENGSFYIPNFFMADRVIHKTQNGEEEKRFTPVDRFRLQAEHFADCILHKHSPQFGPEDAVQNMKIINALRQSAKENRIITSF